MLYLSKDLGKTFSLVSACLCLKESQTFVARQNYVVQFSWGDPAMNQQDHGLSFGCFET